MKKLALPLLLVLACAPGVEYVQTNAPPRELAARPVDQVRIYASSQPEEPYVEVGLIEAVGKSSWSGTEDVFAALRDEAAHRGCDAVIVLGGADKVVGNRDVTRTMTGYRASCIVWKTAREAAR